MNLYHALQTLLDKISENATNSKYGKTEKEMLDAALENQVRMGEAILILGALLHNIAGAGVVVEVNNKEGSKH